MQDRNCELYILQDENGELIVTDSTEPQEIQSNKKRFSLKRVLYAVFAAFFLGMGFWMYTSLFGFTAKARLSHLQVQAKNIHEIALEWQQMEDANRLTTQTGACQGEAAPGTFAAYLQSRFGDDGWYALVCDNEGTLLFVLYSQSRISADELTEVSWEDTYDDLCSPFRRHSAIVSYP